jgi:hypothetical protein
MGSGWGMGSDQANPLLSIEYDSKNASFHILDYHFQGQNWYRKQQSVLGAYIYQPRQSLCVLSP